MSNPKNPIPRIAAQSIAGGLLLMALFTLMWSGIATAGLSNPWDIITLLVFIPLSLIIAAHGLHLLIASKNFPSLQTKADKAEGKRLGLAYGIAFGTEGLLIGATAGILSGLHKGPYIIPAIALIVGLHFYPMAKIFHRTLDYYLATWVSAIAALGIWLIYNNNSEQSVLALVGLATASATTTYGLYMWRIKRQVLL